MTDAGTIRCLVEYGFSRYTLCGADLAGRAREGKQITTADAACTQEDLDEGEHYCPLCAERREDALRERGGMPDALAWRTIRCADPKCGEEHVIYETEVDGVWHRAFVGQRPEGMYYAECYPFGTERADALLLTDAGLDTAKLLAERFYGRANLYLTWGKEYRSYEVACATSDEA